MPRLPLVSGEAACRPATGEAFTRPYLGRSTATSRVAFLEEVELRLPAEVERGLRDRG